MQCWDKSSLFSIQEDARQAIFVLMCKKTFYFLTFPCFFEDTTQMLTGSNYYKVSFQITEIIPKLYMHKIDFFA